MKGREPGPWKTKPSAIYQHERILGDEEQSHAPCAGTEADKPEGPQLQAYPSERDHAVARPIMW